MSITGSATAHASRVRRIFVTADRRFETVSRVLSRIATLGAIALVINVAVDVLLRTFARAPIPGTSEMIAVLWMPIGIALVFAAMQRGNQNIAVDLIFDSSSLTVRRWGGLVNGVVSAAAVALIAFFAVTAAVHATAIGQSTTGQVEVPVWPGKWVVAISLIAMFVEVVLGTIRSVCDPGVIQSPDPSQEEGAVL